MNIKLTDGREINIVEEYNKLRAENKALQDKVEDMNKQLEFYKEQNEMHCNKYYEVLEESDKLYKETIHQATTIKNLKSKVDKIREKLLPYVW